MSRPFGAVVADWTRPDVLDNGAWGGASSDGSFYTSDSQWAQDAYLRLSAVAACVWGLGETLGQLELHAYEKVPGRNGAPATKQQLDDPLYTLLHDDPNSEQTAFDYRFQMQCWASVRPWVIAETTWDRGRPVAMVPRHPSRVKAERLANGKLRYQYRNDDGSSRPILSDNVFRLSGKPVLEYAKESFDLARTIQSQSARAFRKQIRPAGFITLDPNVKYEPDAKKRIKAQIAESGAAGEIAMLPEGMKWNQIGMTHEQAQTVALVTASVEDVGRWFNYPAYRLGVLKAGTVSYASVEMQSLEFVIYTIMPWVQRWEQATRRDLIVRKDTQFAEFLMASLLRGTTKERYDVYSLAIAWGILSVNDVRRLENLNPVPGGGVYLRPLNMTTTAEGQIVPVYSTSPDSPAGRLLKTFIEGAASQIVRKENLAMLRAADKHKDDPQGFEAAVTTFFDSHADYVAAKLHTDRGLALSWARSRRDALLADGPEILPAWQEDDEPAETLAAQVLEDAL